MLTCSLCHGRVYPHSVTSNLCVFDLASHCCICCVSTDSNKGSASTAEPLHLPSRTSVCFLSSPHHDHVSPTNHLSQCKPRARSFGLSATLRPVTCVCMPDKACLLQATSAPLQLLCNTQIAAQSLNTGQAVSSAIPSVFGPQPCGTFQGTGLHFRPQTCLILT